MTRPSDPATPSHFFFVHLQKTAGTVLRQRLAALVGDDTLYPSALDREVIGASFVVDRMLGEVRQRPEVRVVFGHFPLCVEEQLPWPVRTFTLLRDPVERTLSYLRHHRETTPADAHRPLEEIYEDPLRFDGLAHNHMTKMLSLDTDEMTDGMLTTVDFTDARLARAVDALDRIEVVGLSEQFEAFCGTLRRVFGWQLPDEPRWANRSTPVDIEPSFRDRIAADNAADLALYAHAREIVGTAAAGTSAATTPPGA